MFSRFSTARRFLIPSIRCMSTGPKIPAFDYKPIPYEGPSKGELWEMRKKHMNPALFLFYKDPLMVVEGKMQYMFDETGRRYLDMFGGIVTVGVGHCHPTVLKAAEDQMKKIWHSTTIYLNPEVCQYSKELADKLPPHLNNIYFVNSGSEANDLAMQMARLHTGNYNYVALRNGYHGMSAGTQALTALSTWRYPGPVMPGVLHARCPNTYRGPWGPDEPDVAAKYAEDVEDLITHATANQVAGFVAEPIQGVGGTMDLPAGYLKLVYEIVRNHGGVCVADEVQTGFGRMGTHYWGFERAGVSPDIVVMAKSIGNGIPLAAVATSQEIAQSMAQKLHFNTYGGNPVSSAVGRAVLRVIDEENIQDNALRQGTALKDGLLQLQQKHKLIGNVRGQGLLLGCELVKDRDTKAPATEETNAVFERCKELGVVVGKGSLYGNVLRIKPPMCLTDQDTQFFLDVLDQSLTEVASGSYKLENVVCRYGDASKLK